MRWTTTPPRGPDVHVLTFAEEGFSVFSHHARLAGLDKEAQISFADTVNQRDEVGCLLPRARLSPMPRSAVRDCDDPDIVLRHLREMRAAVRAGRVPQRTIAIDLSAPDLPSHVREALERFADETTEDARDGINWIAIG